MTWKDRIDNPYVIVTGEGTRFTLKWMNAALQQDFNLSTFEFPNVPGTLVKRRQPKGRAFSLDLRFDGENHLTQSENFRVAASDPRPWTIIHPYYDQLIVQPVRLRFDNSNHNVTHITGTVLETIESVFPRAELSITDDANQQKITSNEAAVTAFESASGSIPVAEVPAISQNVDILEATGNDFITDAEQGFNFRNTVLQAKASFDEVSGKPLQVLRNIQEVIDFPFRVTASVQARVNLISNQFNRVTTSLGTLLGFNRERKAYYETIGTTSVSALALAAVTDPDYTNRAQVQNTITSILDQYNQFVEDLDTLQSENPVDPDSFVPNADNFRLLESLVNLAVNNLFILAFDARQENTLVLDADTTVIELTHRFYGSATDENIDLFIETNQIGLSEIFIVPKGREVVYLV